MNRMFLALSFSLVSVVVGCSAQGGGESLGTTDQSLSTPLPACKGGDGSAKSPFVIGGDACSYTAAPKNPGLPLYFTFNAALLGSGAKIEISGAAVGGSAVITNAQQNADGSCGALLGSLDKAPELPAGIVATKGVCVVLGRVTGTVNLGTPPAAPAAPDAGAGGGGGDVCADKTAALQAQVTSLTQQLAQMKSTCNNPAPAAPSSCKAQLDAISQLVSTMQGDVSKLSAAAAH